MAREDFGQIKMTFGKFKGRRIEDLPSSYVRWLAENCKLDYIATAADQEYSYREQFDLHQEE